MLKNLFRDVVPKDICNAAVDSFLKACEVLDIVQHANTDIVDPSDLAEATQSWLGAHLAAHGELWWVFKFHQALHMAEMWARRRAKGYVLPNCWPTERLHKMPKRFMKDHRNQMSYEKSLLEEISLEKMQQWSELCLQGLLKPRHDPEIQALIRDVMPHVQSVQVDDCYVSASGKRFKRNDVVLLGPSHDHAVGQIWLHCLLDGTLKTLLSLWPLIEGDAVRRYGTYRICGTIQVIDSDLMHAPTIFRTDRQIATVLWPRTYVYP